jgi:hypothetical protein
MAKPVEDAGAGSNKIILHEKAFAHLTRGMYRSPASAIRELVSNAWDAHANNVHIRTGTPHFVEMTITDDGDGFSEEEFLRIVQGGLGNSEKRQRDIEHPSTRPMIGRLGVGMFGIAQICGSFVISSNPKSGNPFKARIRLYNLLKEELDKVESPLVRQADEGEFLEINIGEYEILTFDPDEFEGTGTRIVADVMHPVFSRTFRESIELKDGVPLRVWKDAIAKQVRKHHSLQEIGEYFRFIWEIAASVPIPYIDDTAIPRGHIRKFQKELLAEDFNVFVDGIQLFKPVWLKGNPNGYTVVDVPETTDTPYNRRVSFSGYIAVQEGMQLKPDELRGIMIRVKGVGIGLYDPSLLDYRFNEGPRTRWITGEIYVTEGLEDALNVDRDSFNRFHPQFKFLQKTVHEAIQHSLLPPVYAKIKERSTAKAEARSESRTQALADSIKESFSGRTRKSNANDSGIVVKSISINEVEQEVDLRTEKPEQLNTKKSNKQLASSVLTLFDLALLQKSKPEMRRTFMIALLKLLREW